MDWLVIGGLALVVFFLVFFVGGVILHEVRKRKMRREAAARRPRRSTDYPPIRGGYDPVRRYAEPDHESVPVAPMVGYGHVPRYEAPPPSDPPRPNIFERASSVFDSPPEVSSSSSADSSSSDSSPSSDSSSSSDSGGFDGGGGESGGGGASGEV
jgi:uncharacterized membrane protein YgcG